jgi:hypothetical protein
LDGRTGARFTLGSAAAQVELRTAELPGLLYRITTPVGSGVAPRVTGTGGVVRLALTSTGEDGPDRVDVVLNRQVRWQIRLAAGAGEQRLDLGDARLSGVELGAATGLVTVRLPLPRGTVPVRLSGEVGTAVIVTPVGVPTRVRLARGAATVRLPWVTRTAVGAGTVLTPPLWAATTGRYLLDARGGIATMVVRGATM